MIKPTRFNIGHLQRAIKATGVEMEVDESKPTEMTNEGMLSIVMDQDIKKQFCASNCTQICCAYYSDMQGSRAEAIWSLLEDLKLGFEPMSEGTAWACDVDL